MAYTYDKQSDSIIINGFEKGIAASPYNGIANIRNLTTSYYPGVAYTNYRRQAATVTTTQTYWLAGTHSTNTSNNLGWTFAASGSTSMTNPVQSATSELGLIYILDDSGQVWKQSAVNSSTFAILANGTGRITAGAGGLAYWNKYLVVFGAGVIEFCGDGTGDAGILYTNWNKTNYGSALNTATFITTFAAFPSNLYFLTANKSLYNRPLFQVNDPVQFTTTGTLPAGLSLLTNYYIKTNDNNTILTVAATIGGAAIILTSDGTGTHTMTDYSTPLPLGNTSALGFTISGVVGATTSTLVSYTDPAGASQGANWLGATGLYDMIMPDNQLVPVTMTHGSATMTYLSPLIYLGAGNTNYNLRLLDTSVTLYRPYVSKVDGSLLFCNGQFIGRIAASASPSITFNPALSSSYTVSFGVTAIPEQFRETVVDMTDLNSKLVVAGQKHIYTWDYLSASCSSPSPVDETIINIVNVLNNIYIIAGQKGNIYISNGYSAQLLYKISDFIAGIIDPVWSWGGIMSRRSKLYFQASAKNTSGTNLIAGIFSVIVSPSMLGETASGLVMEAQNSYGLTPAAGALTTGCLIDNSPSSLGNDSYYSAWSNGATTGGIDYNDTSLWQNWEPTIETDIIPLGGILDKKTLGNIEFKLDRPMVAGDQIRMYWRPSLTDSYVLMGTTTTAQLSDYYPSAISQSQWAQFKIQMSCASSGSSFIPLREVKIHMQ